MENDESNILYTTSEFINCICPLKDNKIALGSYRILIFEQKFSNFLFSIENKNKEQIYDIIQSKRGPIICSENNIIKVYSIFSNYYNLMFIHKRNNDRIYKLKELSNGNIAYSTKDSKIFLFHSTFKEINFKYDLENEEVTNFIERTNNQLILLCVKIKKSIFQVQQIKNKYAEFTEREYYFYLKTLEKENENSQWEIKDKCKITTIKGYLYFNYLVTNKTLELLINDYLIVAIKSFIYIYHIDDDNNFQYYTSILFDIGGSIQSICPFDNNIIGIGSKSGIVLFFEKNELLKRTFVKNKERNNVELKDLVKLDEENIIGLKNIDGKQIINLINKENK